MKKTILLFFFTLVTFISFAQDKSLFLKETYTADGFTLPYRVMYPENYDSAKQYPLVFFLHGAGERGDNNEAQLTHGYDFFVKYNHDQSQFPAIVVAPQCPLTSYWANVLRQDNDGQLSFAFGVTNEPTPAMKAAMGLVDYWLTSGKIDTRRVYIGGLSMGGMGTLEMLWRKPNTFTAAFPVCGGTDLNKLDIYAQSNIGIWLFHGDVDAVVPVKCSRDIYNTLKAKGTDVRYTEYPGVNHNSWDNAFLECGLMPWLFGHKK